MRTIWSSLKEFSIYVESIGNVKKCNQFKAIFIGINDSELNYGQTGLCFQLDNLFCFLSDGEPEVYEITKNNIQQVRLRQ